MARQKMISKVQIEMLIDVMKAKRVARITIPDTIDIVMFEPERPVQSFEIEPSKDLDDTENMTEEQRNMKILLHSAG